MNTITIRSFGDGLTQKIFYGVRDKEVSRFPQDLLASAQRKLDAINAASMLQDLSAPPANRLEKLKGDLKDFWSIRINDQWRIIFIWSAEGLYGVQVVDYH